jgi:hypothetical protein
MVIIYIYVYIRRKRGLRCEKNVTCCYSGCVTENFSHFALITDTFIVMSTVE